MIRTLTRPRKGGKPVPMPEEPRRVPGRKDTKRWCRGKKGVEHTLEWRESHRFAHLDRGQPASRKWWDLVCTRCGKKFRYCTGWFTECVCGHHKRTKEGK